MIKKSIDQIVENGKKEDMKYLSDMMVDLICDLDKYNPKLAHEYKMELYIKAYGEVLTKDMAEKIILDMKPYGMHWTFEDTESVRKKYSLSDIRDVDFWIVMNQGYNDYKDGWMEDNLDMYVTYAKKFILDPDAKPAKVLIYFTEIPY